MSELTRTELRALFSNGLRPDEEAFGDLIDSFLSFRDENVDLVDEDLVLPGGLQLGDSERNEAGTMRLNGTNVQFHNGTQWVTLGAGGGESVFREAGGNGEVAYSGGNVGIGPEFESEAPTFALDVSLDENNDTGDRVRFGRAVISRGTGGDRNDAYLYQEGQDPGDGYALRQRANGEVFLNAPAGRRLRIGQADSNTPAIGITTNGNVVVGSPNNLQGGGGTPFQVNGAAGKSDGQETWDLLSDARVKEEVRDLEAGLDELLRVRPVRYRYNGKAGTQAGLAAVGIVGQEIEEVFPEMVTRVHGELEQGRALDDLRMYNGSALTYVLVNAVKQLAAKVERLEAQLEGGGADGDES